MVRRVNTYRFAAFLCHHSFVGHIAFIAQNHFFYVFVGMLKTENESNL